MGTLAAFLKAAESELGYTESPPGSNKTKFHAEAGHVNGQPWCATFIVAIAKRTGLSLPVPSAYTPAMANGFKHEGQWFDTPEIGDIVFYDFPGGKNRIEHVGIVVGFSGHNIVSIEGNTSAGDNTNGGAVQKRHRSKVNAVGYGRPVFTNPSQQEDPDMATAVRAEDVGTSYALDGETFNGRQIWIIAGGERWPWRGTDADLAEAVEVGLVVGGDKHTRLSTIGNFPRRKP